MSKLVDKCTDCDSCGDGCACIHTIATCRCVQRCECKKTGKIIARTFSDSKKTVKITKRTKVDFRARRIPLIQIANMLNKFFPNKILIPATKINSKITKRMNNVEIGKVIKSLGLDIR